MWIGPTKSHVVPYRTGKAAYKPVAKMADRGDGEVRAAPAPASLGMAADPE